MTPVVVAWSSGKDAAWTLHQLRLRHDLEVRGLLTTVNDVHRRVSMHGVRRELLERQAEAAGLPLLTVPLPDPCPNQAYEAAMIEAIGELRARGVRAIAFGDLRLSEVRQYREAQMRGTEIEPLFPLWGRATWELAEGMLASGLRARLSCVDTRALGAELAGREYDSRLLTELPPTVDPCGENGEFHTFAVDGPMFARPIPVRCGEVVTRGDFVFADLLPEEGHSKRRSALGPARTLGKREAGGVRQKP